MTDDMIRSMKAQMVPSDDVVSDLLAKIAALEASPATADNVVSFDESRFSHRPEITADTAPAKKSANKKSIWFYGTAAAASALVLLSTFAMFGGDGDVEEQFGDIVDNPGIVINDVGVGENTPDSADVSVIDPDDNAADDNETKNTENLAGNPDESDKEQSPSGKNDSDEKDTNQDDTSADSDKTGTSGSKSPDNGKETSVPDTSSSPSDGDGKGSDGLSLTAPPPAADDDNQSGTVEVDNSKVTPGASGTSDISWKREILSEKSVSNITVSGTNYVVESVASPSVASSTEVKRISLDIPATSTTNQTTVEAKVKKVKNVSEELMIAVDAEGFKETLLYTNKNYSPDSLGQFISDAGLDSGNTSFSKSVYCKGEKIGYSSYQKKNVDSITSLAEQHIFCNSGASLGSYSAYNSGTVHVLFKSAKNPTQAIIDFGVSDNGYLYVKMASGKSFTFHIGEDAANSFIRQITGM